MDEKDESNDSSAAGSSAKSSCIHIPRLLSRYKFEAEEKMALKKTIELQKKAIELQKAISAEWQAKYQNLQLEHNKLLANFEEMLHTLESSRLLNSRFDTEAWSELQDLTAENKNLENLIEVLTTSGTQQTTRSRDKSLEGSAFGLDEKKEKTLLQTKATPQDQLRQKNGHHDATTQMCSDLVVLNLPYTANENDLKMYFSQYGELAMVDIKRKFDTGEPRGFAFIRFAEYQSQCTVTRIEHHRIGNRVCKVRVHNKEQHVDQASDLSRVVYVSRCTKEMTSDLLLKYFHRFGEISTVHLPEPFKACAFVRFTDPDVARRLWGRDVIIMGVSVGLGMARRKRGSPRKRKVLQSSEQGLEGELGNAWVPGAGCHGGKKARSASAASDGGFGMSMDADNASHFQMNSAAMATASVGEVLGQRLVGIADMNQGGSDGQGGGAGSGGDSTAGPSTSGGDSRSCTREPATVSRNSTQEVIPVCRYLPSATELILEAIRDMEAGQSWV